MAPHVAQQSVAADGPALVLLEVAQERELEAGQRDAPASGDGLVPRRVDDPLLAVLQLAADDLGEPGVDRARPEVVDQDGVAGRADVARRRPRRDTHRAPARA